MSEIVANLTAHLALDGASNFLAALSAIEGAAGDLKAKLESMNLSLGRLAAGAAGLFVLAGAFNALREGVRGASEDLRNIETLSRLVGDSGLAQSIYSQLEDLQVAMGGLDEVQSAGRRFAGAGFGQGTEGAVKASLDLAAAGGNLKDVDKIAEILSRAQTTKGGQLSDRDIRALAGISPAVADLAKHSSNVEQLIKNVQNSRLAGGAEAQMNTPEGQMARFSAAMREFWETTASTLLPVLTTLARALATVAQWFRRVNDATGGAAGVIAVLGMFTLGLGLLVGALYPAIAGLWGMVTSIAALDIALSPFLVIALAIAAAVAGIVAVFLLLRKAIVDLVPDEGILGRLKQFALIWMDLISPLGQLFRWLGGNSKEDTFRDAGLQPKEKAGDNSLQERQTKAAEKTAEHLGAIRSGMGIGGGPRTARAAFGYEMDAAFANALVNAGAV